MCNNYVCTTKSIQTDLQQMRPESDLLMTFFNSLLPINVVQ